MSILKVRLRKSSSDWQMTRAVFEEELRAIDRALNVPLKRIRVPTQDEFAAHLLEVHCMWCEACPPPGGHGVRIDAAADGSSAALSPQKRKIYVSTSTQTTTYGIDGKLPMDQDTHERWQSLAKKVGVTARQLAGVLLDAVDEGKLGLTVNVESRLLMDSQGTLDDDDDEDVDEDDENVSETFLPLSMTCHGDDKEPQADVNRSPESPSSERVICANFIKEEVLEDDLHVHADQWPDRGIKQEDNDNGSNTEKDKKQRENDEDEGWLEDCGPSSLQDSIPQTCTHENFYDMQSHFERTNQVSDILIKQERDHCDECMDSSRNESTSSQRITDDLSADGYVVQPHFERTNQASDLPIKNKRDHCELDMDSRMKEATSSQTHDEEMPTDGSNVHSHLEKINQVSDLFIKHEGDHCNVDMDSRRNESASCQRPEDRIQTNRSDGKDILNTSEPSCSTHNYDVCSDDNNSIDMCHEGMETSIKEQNSSNSDGKKTCHCSLCRKRYAGESTLHIHLRTHSKLKPYSGSNSDCKQKLYCEPQPHNGPKPCDSSECMQRCSREGHLSVDIKTHTGNKLHLSSFSNKEYTYKSDLSNPSWPLLGQKCFPCSICNKVFPSNDNLTCHMRTHPGQKPYQCLICSKRFAQKGGLDKHMNTHTKKKRYHCSSCNASFYHKQSLTSHEMTHSGRKCSICNKEFSTVQRLFSHLNKKKNPCSKPDSLKEILLLPSRSPILSVVPQDLPQKIISEGI